MTIEESLRGVTRLFLDSAPVIYAVEAHPRYSPMMRDILDRIEAGSIVGFTSPITLAECLVRPLRLGQTELLQDYIDLILGQERIITDIRIKLFGWYQRSTKHSIVYRYRFGIRQ